MSDKVMDVKDKEFYLDMDIIKPPLARPQEVHREKGSMLKCSHDLYIRASKNLSPQDSAKVKELLVKHNETTFHDSDKRLMTTNTIEHKIPMIGRPVRISPHRAALARSKTVADRILKMEEEGTITKSTEPLCSPIILVRRKMSLYYWQIKVADKNRGKTALGSHLSLYEFLCMPFGPATFSRLMDKVLDGLIGKKCLVYLEDVNIFGSLFEET